MKVKPKFWCYPTYQNDHIIWHGWAWTLQAGPVITMQTIRWLEYNLLVYAPLMADDITTRSLQLLQVHRPRNNFYSKWFETRCSWHNLCFDFCKTIHSTENILCRNFGCPQRDIPVDMGVVDHWKSCILCTLFGTWNSLMFRNHLTSDPVTSGAMLRGQPCTSIGSCSLPFVHPVAYYTRHQQRQFLSAQWGIVWIL